jgi:hypothetical protein
MFDLSHAGDFPVSDSVLVTVCKDMACLFNSSGQIFRLACFEPESLNVRNRHAMFLSVLQFLRNSTLTDPVGAFPQM